MRTTAHILAIIAILSFGTGVQATHVLGGEMFYDRLAGDQYRITLKLFRDCGPGNTNGTGFDAEAQFAIYDGNGLFQFSQNAVFPGEEIVPVELNNPCLAAPPSICATWAEYATVVVLPPNSTGYVISYQRCCRTPTILNLPTGFYQGLTCTVQIPPASLGNNSSPRFNDYPPIALCMGQDMTFDHSATDPDGDQLVYDLFTPFAGGDQFDPAPLASPPPYAPIQWASGYTGTDPIDGDPPLTIDPVTGQLSVHPTLSGSFAAGVRVREYRNGQLLSTNIRDVRFDVVLCDVTIISSIQGQQALCTGAELNPVNESVNGQFWHWDFGVPGTDADTSDLGAPLWTYADTGTYVVTLIANPGWPCADTSVSTFHVHLPLDPHFDRPPIACPDQLVEFNGAGNFTSNAVVVWDFGNGASGNGATSSAGFPEVGANPVLLTVQEFGCEASYLDSAIVFPRPEMEIMMDRAGCAGTPFQFAATGAAWTPVHYAWDHGDGSFSNDAEHEHDYEAPGTYDVSLTIWTDEGCIDQRTASLSDWIEVFPIPVADFTVEPDEVGLLDPEISVVDHSQLAQDLTYQIDGIEINAPSFTHYFEDAGEYAITQVVTSGHNCSNSITRTVFVTDHLFFAPNAFTPDGDGHNDTFAPQVKGARLYEIVIIDRWGVERFRSNDPKSEWSGDGQPQGVYTFKVRLAEYGAYSKEYAGHITLLR